MARSRIRRQRTELNPMISTTAGFLKQGIFGPSQEERLQRARKRLSTVRKEIETERVERQLSELLRGRPKKSFFGRFKERI